MQEWAKQFYNSKAWHDTRKAYTKSKRGLCERCLNKGIIKPGEMVHHKTYLTPDNIHDPDISLCFDNLMLVCRDCHADMHKGERRYKVDAIGRVVSR